MEKRPQVGFLTPVTPAQAGNGLAMRAGLFLEGLARSHAVRVLVAPVLGEPASPDGFVERHATGFAVLHLPPPPGPREALTMRLATAAGRERAATLHPLPALCRRATPAAAEVVAAETDGCEGLHAMRLYLAPLLDSLLDRPRRPVLTLDVDDLESAAQRGFGEHEEAARYERLEAHYLPRMDRVIACSAPDAAEMEGRHLTAGPVEVVPNAVRPPVAVAEPGEPNDLLFVGNLSYRPNAEAARWLCRDVLPLLGDVTVAVVGSAPGPEVRALCDDARVKVAADVPDVAPWYAGARVAVAPVRAGGGTRTKVIEAFAHRRPVVATSVGAAGIDLANTPVLLADTAAGFALACRRLLDDPDLAARTAAAGHEMVRATATVDVVAGSIDRLFRNMLAS